MKNFLIGWLGMGLLGTAVLSGCVNKTYVQRGHSSAEMATISTVLEPDASAPGTDGRLLYFSDLDGKSLFSHFSWDMPTEVRVAPGRHVLLAHYWHKSLRMEHRVEVDFIPGGNYQLHEGTEGGELQFWLTRQGSNARIPM